YSIFFFDVKGELWQATSGYRQMCMGQKVLKFEPLQQDGSSVRWNPLAEINFQTPEESGDIESIVAIMVKPDGEKQGGGDPFWDNSAAGLLKGVIMHLLYKFYQEGRRLPCPSDIMSLLSSPDKSTKDLFHEIKTYPHISPHEFLELEYKIPGNGLQEYLANTQTHPIAPPNLPDDAKEEEKAEHAEKMKIYKNALSNYRLWFRLKNLVNAYEVYRKGTRHPVTHEILEYDVVKFRNCLKEVYGEYVMNLREINDYLQQEKHYQGPPCVNLEEVRQAILKCGIGPDDDDEWKAPPPPKEDNGGGGGLFDMDDDNKKEEKAPSCLHILLTHSKVAEAASNIVNGADQTVASILQTAQTAMVLYQNPVVQKNTEVSDFCIRDLLKAPWDEEEIINGKKVKRHYTGVALYLCMESREVQTLKALSRLLINSMLQGLIRSFEFDASGGASMKQRLLLMLDEFPQLGNLKQMELALAVCAGYGIKICIVSQDVNQLNKEYTKDNSIGSNCHVHIYFTPNIDAGGATAESISKQLGKKTIKTVSHSDGGGLGKGSNSESLTGRNLMDPDEVSHMSSEEEIVFVAGNHPIKGKKFRYYLSPLFLSKLNRYPKVYAKYHGLNKLCQEAKKQTSKAAKIVGNTKYTRDNVDKLKEKLKKANLHHPLKFIDFELETALMENREPNFSFLDPCLVCAGSIKREHTLPLAKCPAFPYHSDQVTRIFDFPSLFNIHAQDARSVKRRIELIRQERMWKDSMTDSFDALKKIPPKESNDGKVEDTTKENSNSGDKKVNLEKVAPVAMPILINGDKKSESSVEKNNDSAVISNSDETKTESKVNSPDLERNNKDVDSNFNEPADEADRGNVSDEYGNMLDEIPDIPNDFFMIPESYLADMPQFEDDRSDGSEGIQGEKIESLKPNPETIRYDGDRSGKETPYSRPFRR
ncbi:MAG: type IV secretory system conjugative DNA transfer family protein, partial [Selenomonadaceae bacterium]|nr:type IV secretory system conjugative DNA transfer family protein [Selenomonadaceae bacterium]